MDFPSADTFVNFAAGLIGAAIGGYCTLLGAEKAHALATKKEADAEHERMVSTLMLLRTEIETAWTIYRTEYADDLLKLPDGEPYLTGFPIGESPFSIFNSAPQALNLLPRDLAKDVVHFYMRAKGLIAMIEMNNQDYEQALQHGRRQLTAQMEQASQRYQQLSEEDQQQAFQSGVEFMAALQGMGGTPGIMRDLTRELEPVVQRITAAVDELLVPTKGNKLR